ncbi:RHS repeat-associated core domain-containing protein, partial [Actinophytocola glycyrrhizae]
STPPRQRPENSQPPVTTEVWADPSDRTTTRTDKAGTSEAKTTDFAYLGLTDKVAAEEIAGQLDRTYQYDAYGRRLTQQKKDTDGSGPEVAEDSFYGYNPHTDVETLTTTAGDTKATYGYTAYGNNDEQSFSGIDKPDAQNPGKEPFNFYRYTGKRFDPDSGGYDMGFRDYQPGINRFTVRDTYNGALADVNLGTNTWTGNRYSLAGGNPITGIEIDGHIAYLGGNTSVSIPRAAASDAAIATAQNLVSANPVGSHVELPALAEPSQTSSILPPGTGPDQDPSVPGRGEETGETNVRRTPRFNSYCDVPGIGQRLAPARRHSSQHQ